MFNIFPLSAPRAQRERIFSNLRGARCPARVRGIDIGDILQSCRVAIQELKSSHDLTNISNLEKWNMC